MMDFDDIARVIGYLTLAWWALMIIIVIIILFLGKAAATREKFSEFLSVRGGCRKPDGTPCR